MKLGVVQMSLVGELSAGTEKHLSFLRRAASEDVDLLCFPEMSLTGYNRGILGSPVLKESVDGALSLLQTECGSLGIGAIVGHAYPGGERLVNRATVLLPDGAVHSYDKTHLVHQEESLFIPGDRTLTFDWCDQRIGVIICRDQNDPTLAVRIRDEGAGILAILAAHYYPAREARLKLEKNRALPIARAVETRMWTLLANTVGTHVGYLSLGNSLIVAPDGAVVVSAGESEETILSVDLP